jgi:hypothetical protein
MTPLDDDDLRAMLEARAGRASIDPVAIVAEGRRRAFEPPPSSHRGPVFGRVAAALGGLAVFAAVIALVAVPLAFRPAASPVASSSGPARTFPPIQGAVTVSQLESALEHPGTAAGITVALQGELIPDPTPCPTAATCPLEVAGVTTPHIVVPVEGQDLTPLPASGRLAGVFALRITDRSIEGRVVLEELGQIAPAGDGLTWPVSGVAAAGHVLADLFATTGWIVRTPLHPCPSSDDQKCGTEDYLTEEAYQPARIDGSVVGPPTDTSINLPMGSYDAWAPAPNVLPDGVEPRPVTLLLRLIKGVACPTPKDANTSIDCYGLPYDTWQIAGRLDPLPEAPTASPDPASTAPPDALPTPSQATAGPQVFSAAELAVVLSHRPRVFPPQTRPTPVGEADILLFDGTITLAPSSDCLQDRTTCLTGSVVGAPVGRINGGAIRVIDDPSRDRSTWEFGSLTGTFALRDTGGAMASEPVVELVDRVVPDVDGVAWRPGRLGTTSPIPGQRYVVAGWLVAGPPSPCPTTASGVDPSCPSGEWLTDVPYQPVDAGAGGIAPDAGLPVQAGSYDTFAPGPERDGLRATPRFGNFLVQRVRRGANPPLWQVVGRVGEDPLVEGETLPTSPIDCGRLDAADCEWVVQLVRSAAPDAFASATRIVAENGCPPGAFCVLGFNAVVVLVLPDGGPSAYSVFYLFRGLPKVGPYLQPLPAHVQALLDRQ